MLDRAQLGDVPPKHHVALRDGEGQLRWEHCLTREGFDGPYTILYHAHRPHEQSHTPTDHGWVPPTKPASESRALAKRHFRSARIAHIPGPMLDTRVPLLFNEDVTVGVARPTEADPVYFVDGDSDTLVFVKAGGGVLRSSMGDVTFEAEDYVYVPKGVLHRWLPEGPQEWLTIECHGGMRLPRGWRNETGQLRMDAPLCHRDFRRPEGPLARDEGIRTTVVKRSNRFYGFLTPHSPLDLVGWDGSVYPWALPIQNFQPRAGLVHLPPTLHGTFACRGGLICSFVPRMVDWHENAIPCPYPHSSVDVDELLFYVRGDFTSREGVESGSISYHPSGIPHGPHPGAYERSIGTRETNEMAVMLDCAKPLLPTEAAIGVEDSNYHDSFIAGSGPS